MKSCRNRIREWSKTCFKMLKYLIFFSLLLFIVLTEGCRKCPKGIKTVNCFVNPCQGQKCKDAKCRANYCGGCNRLWYTKDGSDVTNKCECKCSTFPCPGATDCAPGQSIKQCKTNPCNVSSCRSHPNAKCCPSYCGGCQALWFEDGKPVQCNRKG